MKIYLSWYRPLTNKWRIYERVLGKVWSRWFLLHLPCVRTSVRILVQVARGALSQPLFRQSAWRKTMKRLLFLVVLLFITFAVWTGIDRYKMQCQILDLEWKADGIMIQRDILVYRLQHPLRRNK